MDKTFLITMALSLILNIEDVAGAVFSLTSPAFGNGQQIPARYTCNGEDISPPLQIANVPEGTKALALIMDDPDAPKGSWIHWVMFNIPPETTTIAENFAPGIQGTTDFQEIKYSGPCPPHGKHRYYFKLYALTDTLNLGPGCTKDELLMAMEGQTLMHTELMGTYSNE